MTRYDLTARQLRVILDHLPSTETECSGAAEWATVRGLVELFDDDRYDHLIEPDDREEPPEHVTDITPALDAVMPAGIKYPQVLVRFSGQNGNAFNLIGLVATELRRQGRLDPGTIQTFRTEALSASSYHEVQLACMRWVTILLTDHSYTCAKCGGVFTKGRSDDVAAAEFEATSPGVPLAEAELICEDCYVKFLEWLRDHDHAAWRRATGAR